MLRILIGILIIATAVVATPVERAPTVVDVPAGIFGDDIDDAIPIPTSQEKDVVEVIKPELPSVDSVEVVGGNKKTDTDDLGFRVPTIFVIRRPVISDRFPFFQQSPFFGPSSIFQNRRPLIQRPSFLEDTVPVSDDSSDHDMISHMEQMMNRMQQQMSSLFGSFANPSFPRRPLRPVFPSLSFESDEDNNKSGETTVNIDSLPPNYSNSTSETKVVDGHVVQVNKTIHKISSGNNTSGFFHFEVINVRPTEGAKTDDAEAPIPEAGATDVKPIVEIPTPVAQPSQPPKAEDPSLNEVGETKPIDKDQESTFPYFVNRRKSIWATNDEDEASSEVEWIPRTEYQRPSTQTGFRSRARSLSDDLRVNKVVADQGILSPYLILNPDVELFQV